ncbi:hypothetical protein DL93DRAFT_2077671 [Clavulina sp. PMI_390]|nr:hypothetical protein DL93DRAFT_2077671 [Clavulina sp. PMI_390]
MPLPHVPGVESPLPFNISELPVSTTNKPQLTSHPFRCILHGVDPSSAAIIPDTNPSAFEFRQIYNLFWDDPWKGELLAEQAYYYFIGVLLAYSQTEDVIRSNVRHSTETLDAGLHCIAQVSLF